MGNNISHISESNKLTTAPDLVVALVEDSILMRAHVAASLSDVKGVGPIWQAHDVPSALRLLGTLKPDVLILDIELPGQSGLDLLKVVRKEDTVVIIMLTIHDHPKMRQRAADLGVNYFFSKLSEFDRVADVCRELAGRRTSRDGSFSDSALE
jgi:DNA-binding NarL/FixJ family response regulator